MVRCAVCKYSRKRNCVNNCAFAELFPAEDDVDFKDIATLWGLGNVKKLISSVDAQQRPKLIKSLVFEANHRLKDSVNGVLTYIIELEQKIADLESELKNCRLQSSQNWFSRALFHQEVPGQFAIPNQPSPFPNPNNVQQHYNPPYNQVLNQPQVPYCQLQPNLQPPLGPLPNPNYLQQVQNSFPYSGFSNQPQVPNYQLQPNLQPPRGPFPNPNCVQEDHKLFPYHEVSNQLQVPCYQSQPNLQPPRGPFPNPNYVQQANHPFPDHQVSNQPQVPYYLSGPNLPNSFFNQPILPNGQPQGLNQWGNDPNPFFNQPTLTNEQLDQWVNELHVNNPAGVIADPPDANGPGVNIANIQQGNHPFPDQQVSNQPQVPYYQSGPNSFFNQPILPNGQPQGLNQRANDPEVDVPAVVIANEPEANDPNVVTADAPEADDPFSLMEDELLADDPEADGLGANTCDAQCWNFLSDFCGGVV
ncbi:protein HAIKU1-like [Quercus robur]|uniref:protein HAIKU1-like n=1 Tax=Quercus robur TaxID=38942 RepID=UPI00216254BB|nr:protein HAIKU1-like [Quercus robur]